MAASLLSRLPLMLFLLLAASETVLCKERCPVYCAKHAVVVTEEGVSTVEGPQARFVIDVVRKLQHTPANAPVTKVFVHNTWVFIPKNLVIEIKKLVKSQPEIWQIVKEILRQKFGKPIPQPIGPHPIPPVTRKGPKTTTKPKPQPIRPRPIPPVTRKGPNTTTKPKPQPIRPRHTTKKPTPSKPIRTTPTKKNTRPTTRKTTRPTTKKDGPAPPGRPNEPRIMPPAEPKITYPRIDSFNATIIGQEGLNCTVQSILEVVIELPNFLLSYIAVLQHLGVKMPELGVKGEVTYVVVNKKTIKLPKPLVVSYTVGINGKAFRLPAQLKRLAEYLSTHQAQLVNVVSVIRQLQGTFSTNKRGFLSSVSVFGVTYTFQRPISVSVSVHGRNFVLPRDIRVLLTSIKHNPADFFKVQMLLEAFGVHFKPSPGANSIEARIGKETYQIHIVKQVKVTINNRQYSIPGDLGTIFSGSAVVSVGELIAALQMANVVVKVDKQTGGITGIVMGGVTIPFPVAAYLRVNIYGRTYTIPYDLPKIISVLENKHMPSSILSILYMYYGVVPVRGPKNVVVALSFNGVRYKVKPQPQTPIVIHGYKLLLPRDSDKMNQLVLSGKVGVVEFMHALQMAGYTFIPEADGALRRIQKGTEIIELSLELRLSVKLGKIVYRVPNDLPRLVKVLSGYSKKVIDKVMVELGKLGVRFTIKGKRLLLFFNGATYEVQLKDSGGTTTMIIILNNKRYVIPAQLNELVADATSQGSFAVDTIISAFKSNGIKVKRSSDGGITSIVMDGKRYKVGRVADGSSNVKVKIRGKTFFIPRDMPKIRRKLKNFKIFELTSAILRVGAKLVFDDDSYTIGILYRGRRINFKRKFRITVKVDQTGKMFYIPGQLGQVAHLLASGKWKWKEVRKALIEAGVQVPGGIVNKRVKKFSFMGKDYTVKK